jgi:biopolymer transport protein ExbD
LIFLLVRANSPFVKLTRTARFSPALFPLVPVVNVLFLVFMLFAMSSRFVLQPGISVALPLSSFTLGPQHDPQIVSVTSAPVPAIYHRDQKVTLEELDQRLGATPSKQRSLIVKADRRTPYDLVFQVMNQGLRHGFSVVLAATPETP